ncbi:uncharacterized protein LOC120257919 [Dioscorea cayenensis subsp. rotundata]|uniref:Uncharacterized protein LOC120257919 n=1 Tax=Dioscorea cayennensis subsp. rotundata TaxID=55577 RepID=A0AB40B1K9_DIOCR|nr:uncharacterized protein LOC120257919 [Dioscorea cayenensis subsp. rotundata]
MAAAEVVSAEIPKNADSSDEALLSSYLGLSFAVFLGLLPRGSISYVTSLQSRARVLSLKLFHAEDQLRQLRSRRAEDSKANARVVEIFAGHRLAWHREERRLRDLLGASSSEIAALKERVDELERSEADLRVSVETLQREVSEREEMLEFMARGAEGDDFVEKEEIREELGEYSGDFTGASAPEGLDPGVPEVEEMAMPYGKQMNCYAGDFSMPLSGFQDNQYDSLDSMYHTKHFVARRESPWKVDGDSTGVSAKLKSLDQELSNLEKVGKGDLSKIPSLLRKQAKRYQSLTGKIDDLCRKMQTSDPCEPTLSPEFRTQRQTEFLLEAFRLQNRATKTRQKLNLLEAEATKSYLGDELVGEAKVSTKRSLDSIRINFKDIQRNLEIWLARIMGDLEGILARDGMSRVRDYYLSQLSRDPFVR